MTDELLIFDLEATGVEPLTDFPVSVASVLVNLSGQAEDMIVMNSLCRPPMLIPPESSEIHGIYDKDVRFHPPHSVVCWTFKVLVQGYPNAALCGYNSNQYDIPMMSNCLGVDLAKSRTTLDLLNAAFRYYPTLESHKLTFMYEHFFGEELEGAHGAIYDVLATGRILRHILQDRGMTADEMIQDMAVPKPYPVMPIGKHKGKLLSKIPGGWAYWMKNNATGMRPDLQATVDAILRR